MASLVYGLAFDAYGYFPEQLIAIEDHTQTSRPRYATKVCVPIPELNYNDDMTRKVAAVYAGEKDAAFYAQMPVKEKPHYPFQDGRVHTSLVISMEHSLEDGLPYKGSVSITEAIKDKVYNFRLKKTHPKNVSNDVKKLRALGQLLIERDNNPNGRFANEHSSPDKDDNINLRLMRDANNMFREYACQMGIPIVGRRYNIGGGYSFCTMESNDPKPSKKLDTLLDKRITIHADNARDIFCQPINQNGGCYVNVTKVNKFDAAMNAFLVDKLRLGPYEVNYKKVDDIVARMNYMP